MIKFAIVYLSFSGNTRDLAQKIKHYIEECGHFAHIFHHRDSFNLEDYDYVLFGSLTWDYGKLPIPMRKLLRSILIDSPQPIKRCSLFGTGETQWGMENYCRAVEEMQYHLRKNGVAVDFKLKIEQNPVGKDKQVKEYVNKILEALI